MRRKVNPKSDQVVPAELLELARQSILADGLKKPASKCSVCGAETADGSDEPLCWVCRRLKISAWRDIEHQMPMQD
ncbi:MAG: hypothetical protein ABSH00_11815 [Bryobacteraceae bacterium]|jgi:hypothetical protein